MGQIEKFLYTFNLLTLFICINSQLYSPIRTFEKEIILDSKSKDVIYGLSEKTAAIYYGFCSEVNSTKEVCKLTVEVPVTNDNRFVFKKTCIVESSTTSSKDIVKKFLLKPLSHKKALQVKYHYDKESYSYSPKIIKMTIVILRMTDCGVVEISLLDIKAAYVNTRNYEDIFDVLYMTRGNNPTHPNCQKYVCRVTYSSDGTVILEPWEYLRKPNFGPNLWHEYWVPLILRDSASSVSVLYGTTTFNRSKTHQTDNIGSVYRVHNGIATEVFRASVNASILGVSTSQWKLSFCLRDGGSALCRQYDPQANLLMKFNVSLLDYSSSQDDVELQPYNLQGGGLILLIVGFDNKTVDRKVDSLRMILVGGAGNYTLPLEISYDKMDYTCYYQSDLLPTFVPFVNMVEDGGDICLRLSCLNKNQSYHRLRYRIECFSKSYFQRM